MSWSGCCRKKNEKERISPDCSFEWMQVSVMRATGNAILRQLNRSLLLFSCYASQEKVAWNIISMQQVNFGLIVFPTRTIMMSSWRDWLLPRIWFRNCTVVVRRFVWRGAPRFAVVVVVIRHYQVGRPRFSGWMVPLAYVEITPLSAKQLQQLEQ